MAETTRMELADWLDDLTVRFILNLPNSELSSVPRLCFQVEEAQWYYEDFVRPAAAAAGNPLPSLPLRTFCLKLFQHCPLLSGYTDAEHIAAYEEFLSYKVRVPVRGAILMDESMEKLVLVKGWKKGASWSFPRGKINKDEKDLDCAIREVYEETGFDVRQAGLVPDDEDEVKYIDITMREQHMRLFVFRGVAEETYFEPKTRKEISKIAWYNVRDLPGFKKQKGGADYTNHANKFYMVAPFLGPLKKWINQQRRSDVAAIASGSAQHMTDYEDVTEEYHEPMPEFVPPKEDRSEELRRLMGLGMAPQPPQPTNTAPHAQQPKDLLALLRGSPMGAPSGTIPHTPLEQINGFPPQPETPHPHHPRHPSMGYQHSAPQFPFSPQRLQQQQQQQRDFSAPATGGTDPVAQFMQPSSVPGYTPANSHQQQYQQHRQSFPADLPSGHQYDQLNGRQFQQQPAQPPYIGQQMPSYMQHRSQPSQDAFMAQGPQGAIGSGPPVPKAEHLPMPRLNTHSMQLLDAFKRGNKPVPQGGATANRVPTQASQHQNALLDLFKKPGAASSEPAPAQQPEPAAPTDIAERPANLQARRPTLNEITRTLPKTKISSPDVTTTPQFPTHTPNQAAGRPKPGEVIDSANRKPHVRASPSAPQPEAAAQAPPVSIMQRPPSTQTPRSPKPKQAHPSSSPKQKPHAKGRENGTPAPSFTILARPTSSRGPSKSPAAQQMPASPLRNETSKPSFQPQVLRRPESVDPATVQKAAETVENTTSNVEDKRDQLLALFGKPPATAGASSPAAAQPASPPAPIQAPIRQVEDRKNSLLSLFTSPTPSTATTPQPPSAPQLVPERRPSSQTVPQHVRQQTPQNAALLDLFHRPGGTSSTLNSPGTPISPFALGTPVAARQGPQHLPTPAQQQAHAYTSSQLQRRESGMSNVGSVGSLGTKARQESLGGSGAVTPVEAKGFLLDYLNGVVQKEGHRGANRRV